MAICLSAPDASAVLTFLKRGSLGRAPGPWGCCGPWFLTENNTTRANKKQNEMDPVLSIYMLHAGPWQRKNYCNLISFLKLIEIGSTIFVHKVNTY